MVSCSFSVIKPSSIVNPNPLTARPSRSIKNIVSVCEDKNLFDILKSVDRVTTSDGNDSFNFITKVLLLPVILSKAYPLIGINLPCESSKLELN